MKHSWLLLVCGLVGCAGSAGEATPPPAARLASADAGASSQTEASFDAAAPARGPVELTVLFTTDEHGWLAAHDAGGRRWGGVGPLLAKLVRDEGHCAPLLAPAVAGGLDAGPAAASEDRCVTSHTLLLSGGDNFTGPPVSGLFRGASMAEAMGRLGYAASALGNHELDFGRDAFFANQALSDVRYLAANLSDVAGAADAGSAAELARPYVIVERGGVRVGVVGLASVHTLTTAVASRFGAVRLDEPEATLARVVPELWAAGADVALLLVHECADELVPALERHPEWQLSFVGSGHCHRELDSAVAGTAVMSSGWRLDHYARARLRVALGAAGPRRAELLEHAIVEVSSPATEPAPSIDPALDARVATWQREVDRALGEVIGFSTRGLEREAPALGEWVVESWRRGLSVDVAVTTRGSIRQELPPGPITLATISSILPFDNELVVASVPGEMLLAMLREPAVIAAGARRTADGSFVLGNGRKLRPDARYRVATTDYLYGGGDHCRFREADPAAQMTGIGWRQPVIDWTRALGSRADHPLESLLPRSPR